MNWKEFLKPTYKKIAIGIILNLVMILSLLFIPTAINLFQIIDNIFPWIFGLQPSGLISYILVLLLTIVFYFYKMTNLKVLLLFIILMFFFGGLGSGYWYLISCLIIWIYTKTRKK